MPCASTCCSWAAGVRPGSGCPAAFRLAVPNTATRTARPSAPPTCCITFTMLEAAPESVGATPASDAVVSGTNTRPIPMPKSIIGPNTPDQ